MRYARFPATEATMLAAYRTQAGWEVCAETDQLWLRAFEPPPELWLSLPFSERFTSDASERLVRQGQSVPVRRVPEGPWVSLIHWLPVQRSSSLPGGVRPPPLLLRPVRAENEEVTPDLLLVERSAWETWAAMAPLIRLEPLRFALSSDGRVCVQGQPLPPLPGDAWVRREAIALRAGMALPATTTATWLAKLLDVPAGGMALWHEDGSSEVLPLSAFVPATRANVRASVLGMTGPA